MLFLYWRVNERHETIMGVSLPMTVTWRSYGVSMISHRVRGNVLDYYLQIIYSCGSQMWQEAVNHPVLSRKYEVQYNNKYIENWHPGLNDWIIAFAMWITNIRLRARVSDTIE